MPRYKLTVEYDGTGLVGWQRQDNGPSVQGLLEAAILRLCGETVTLAAAGRTDAGVHAGGQVAHADIEKPMDPERVRDGLNYWLRVQAGEAGQGTPVAVREAEIAPEGFHARFSATSRHYLYRIANRRAPPTLTRAAVWWLARPLDVDGMAEGARRLVGHHDFSTFRASECQASSPVKTLDYLTVERRGEEVLVWAGARSFLHHQVRNMVGSLILVGNGRWTPDDIARALAAKRRAAGGPTAPPHGLSLIRVGYSTAGESDAVGDVADQHAEKEIDQHQQGGVAD